MKTTKKILSIVLAVMLLVGTVVVGVNADTTMVYGKAGSKLVYTAEADKTTKDKDGYILVQPGDEINVSVYMQANYYIGAAGSEIFAWTTGFFNTVTKDTDITKHNFINNYSFANDKLIAAKSATQLGYSDKSHEGYLCGRLINTEADPGPFDASTPVLVYKFKFTVASTAADGATADFLMPEACSATVATTSRMKQIYAAVNNSATEYGSASIASSYPETIDLTGTVLKFKVGSADVDCNYKALNDAMAQYTEDLANKALYTAESWAEYEAAYTAATKVPTNLKVDAEGANQATIDAAAKALTDAKAGLDLLEYCSYTALENALLYCSELDADEDYYNPTDLATWKAALAAAEALMEGEKLVKTDANQAKINDAAQALSDAYDELYEIYADTTPLEDAIDLYDTPEKSPEFYDVAKYEAWQLALANARDALGEYDGKPGTAANNAAIEALALNLKNAYEALEANFVSLADLTKAVADYSAPAYAAEYYDADEYATYEAALAAANKGLTDYAQAADTSSNRAKVAALAADLKNAFEALDARFVDTTALDFAVTAYATPAYASVYYDAAEYAAWEAALKAAKDADFAGKADTAANQAAVAKLAADLKNAFESLDARFVDTKALDDAVAAYAAPAYAAEYYDADEYAAWQAAFKAADEADFVLKPDTADFQAAVAKLAADLKNAFEALDARFVDTKALDDAVAAYAAPAYAAEYYDADEYAAWQAAFKAADEADFAGKADTAANQAAVAKLAADLKNAFEALDARFVNTAALLEALKKTPAYSAEYYDTAAYAAWDDAAKAGATVYADMDGAADTAENRKAVADAAAAINNTFAKLVPAFISYTPVEEAAKDYGTTPEASDAYTTETYEAYAAALAKVNSLLANKDENAPASNEALAAEIAAAAAELEAAFNALELAPVTPSLITSVVSTQEHYKVGDTVKFNYVCSVTNVTKIQLVFSDGSTTTYHRTHSAVSVKDNGDGTETWTIATKIYKDESTVTAKAKLGKVWEENGFKYKVKTSTGEDFSVKSAEVLLDGVAVTEYTTADTVVLKIVCGPNTFRMRLVDQSNGATATYSRTKATQDENSNWVWLITRKSSAGQYAYDIYTTGSTNKLTDEGTDLAYTVKAPAPVNAPSTGDKADIVVSAAVVKARVVCGNTVTVTVVTDKNAKGVRVNQNGTVHGYNKDTASAVVDGDTLVWTITYRATRAGTYNCAVEALYGNQWMANGTSISYRVIY